MITYVLCDDASAPEVTADTVMQMAADLQDGYNDVFCPVWGALAVRIIATTPQEDDDRVLHLVDSIPEAPDALAYHTEDAQGRKVLRLGVETIRQNLSAGQTLLDAISIAASHEIFETAIDAPCNGFVQVKDWPAPMLCDEVCDPVESGSFTQGKTAVSNFVFPSYFDPEGSAPFDQCGQISAPLSCAPGGYQAWSDGTQTFGASVTLLRQEQIKKYGRRVSK